MLAASELACVRGERKLFENLAFTLEPGTLLRIAGANGSGKTSLLRIICGLAMPAHGEVRWQGQPVRTLREEYHRQLIYIGHLPAVKDDLTAAENLEISCALSGARADASECRATLERLGLSRYADQPARHLSQGQRRRVALARLAASNDAALWVLDEPFTALDTSAIALVVQLITAHVARGGIAVMTSHQEVAVSALVTCIVDLGG
ncbi:MAG TPA: cytochrome c biogenesis heme-transporting ATPase CcmA [Longimicrobiales bacterium]